MTYEHNGKCLSQVPRVLCHTCEGWVGNPIQGGKFLMLTGQSGIRNLASTGCLQGKIGEVQNRFQVLNTIEKNIYMYVY